MIDFTDLNLGFTDAYSYHKRENRELLNRFFVKNEHLDRLLNPNIYFLVGDKGTGKTAYSVFLANNNYKNSISSINYLGETEYTKFIAMKKQRQLSLSDYTSIWKVLILLLFSKRVSRGEDERIILQNANEFKDLLAAIDQFYNHAFAPEIQTAMNFVDNTEVAVSLFNSHSNLQGKRSKTVEHATHNFQLNLLYLEDKFCKAMAKLNLSQNHLLFIDGIDIRPRHISYEDYLECVRGLANAVWQLNNSYFANIKDSRGRMRVILLVRPDIFAHLGLQNLNTKMNDNSVLLDWRTTYPAYRTSQLFLLADKMLSVQQEELQGEVSSWDYYFPFKNVEKDGKENDSFVSFLRFSMFRPRDIITLMTILQKKKKKDRLAPQIVTADDFDDPEIRTAYSNYLLGEIKDFLTFYHTDEDYQLFRRFFNYLNGKTTFTYDDYMKAYNKFADYIEANDLDAPLMFGTSDQFLQFLYNLNIICYIKEVEDGENHIHWSFREKSYANYNPQVEEGLTYRIHYGLQKALDTGKQFVKRREIRRKKA